MKNDNTQPSAWSPGSGHQLDQVASTNATLKELGGAIGTWVRANSQSAGRGRGAHDWHSPEGNLYMSVLVPRRQPLTLLSLAAGVAVAEACQKLRHDVWLKWPNDIFVDRQKCGGILCEALDHAVVMGLGLNLTAETLFDGAGFLPSSLSPQQWCDHILEELTYWTLQPVERITARWIAFRDERKSDFFEGKQRFHGKISQIDLDQDRLVIVGENSHSLKASLAKEKIFAI